LKSWHPRICKELHVNFYTFSFNFIENNKFAWTVERD